MHEVDSRGKRALLPFAVGFASLVWLLLRTGTRPSRAAYPCQKAAMANASAWLGTLVLPAALVRRTEVRILVFLAAAAAIFGIGVRAAGVVGSAPAAGTPATVTLSLAGRQQAGSTPSDIFAVQGTSGADGAFGRLVGLMERGGLPFYSLIGPRDVVIIKVNSQWDERGGTNTDLVRSIIDSIVRHPAGFTGEIVIADNGQGQYGARGQGGSLSWTSNNAIDTRQSMQAVAGRFSAGYRVSTALWDRITTTKVAEYSQGDERDGYVVDREPSPRTGIVVSYPKFTTPYGTRISFRRGIWNAELGAYDSDRLKVINVPVLKTHSIYGVTACVKHYMGVGSEKLTRSSHRSVGAGGMGTEMAQTRVPVLNVLDAVWINANPGRGPSTAYSDAVQTSIVAASRDPVALDCWAAKNILMPAAQKLGHGNTVSLDPDVTTRGSFGDWLRLSMRELQSAGYTATVDLEAINIVVGR